MIKTIFYLSIFYLSLQLASFCSNKYTNPKIRGVNISYTIPIVDKDGSIIKDSSHYKVFYYKNLIVYQFKYKFDSSYNGKLLLLEDRDGFFVFHKDSLFGYSYDYKTKSRDNKKLVANSMVKMISLESAKLDTVVNLVPDSSFTDSKSIILTEVYKHEYDTNRLYNYTLYLTYNKQMNYIKESFSRKLDSAKKMKLTEIVFKFETNYSKEYKITFPKKGNFFFNEGNSD
jgi:hypothetical protein